MARPRVHAAVSAAIGVALWRRSGRVPALVAPLVGGVLVDVDHLLDFALFRWHRGHGPLFLVFHGWEFVPLLWWLERRLLPSTASGITVGYVAHLAVDQATNDLRSHWIYSWVYRASRRFSPALFGRHEPALHGWRESPLRQLWRWF